MTSGILELPVIPAEVTIELFIEMDAKTGETASRCNAHSVDYADRSHPPHPIDAPPPPRYTLTP